MTDAVSTKSPLEDLMVAMDVVDTLRHQQGIAARELDAEGRQDRLLERLRELYQGQGIEVPDHILREGIEALEQERFQYQSVEPGFSIRLAKIWVSRSRWGKPIGWLAVIAALFYGIYFVRDVLPQRQLHDALPNQINTSVSRIRGLAKSGQIIEQATLDGAAAQQAIADSDFDGARKILGSLDRLQNQLQQEYSIRIVSRPGESSGVWRIPDVNQQGRNYYLIVEAIDREGGAVPLEVVSEESNVRKKVTTWGLRVNEQTFYQIAEDKQDDGIIQRNIVGRKQAGHLEPQFSIATTGATITEW